MIASKLKFIQKFKNRMKNKFNIDFTQNVNKIDNKIWKHGTQFHCKRFISCQIITSVVALI